MKTIGMIGGMSWESTVEYYRILNETVKERLGGLHSAKCVLHSVDFGEIEPLMRKGDWVGVADPLIDAGAAMASSGADVLIICTNTMHKLFHALEEAVKIPILHIADATGRKIKERNIQTVALLGTRFVMEEDFYKGRISEKFGLDVLVPDSADMDIVHRIIFDELCRGEINPASRDAYVAIIKKLVDRGAEGVILGCTEIELLVQQEHVPEVPLIPSAETHIRIAADIDVYTNRNIVVEELES